MVLRRIASTSGWSGVGSATTTTSLYDVASCARATFRTSGGSAVTVPATVGQVRDPLVFSVTGPTTSSSSPGWRDTFGWPVSYTHLRAHETDSYLVCRLLLE